MEKSQATSLRKFSSLPVESEVCSYPITQPVYYTGDEGSDVSFLVYPLRTHGNIPSL